MIKKVIHIADVHIPNSNSEKPYNEMLKKFLKEVYSEVKDYEKGEVVVMMVGDIYHNKIRTSNEARKTFHEFLNYLNAMVKTYIVAGNHDMLENNKDRLDSITPTFDIANVYENVVYLDKLLSYKSGYVIDDNIIWVLYSMHDNFSNPNIAGLKEKYPDKKIIGLYHGDVVGATTDMGRMTEDGINTDLFEGCDYVMAGHIHKYQTIKKNGIPIVYSGSLFQQNCGENITGHGYVLWDIESGAYEHKEVENDYRILKFHIDSFEDVTDDVEKLENL